MARVYDSFPTSCYVPKTPDNNSCQLETSPSPSKLIKISSPDITNTQINIVSLNRHLNRLRPRIAVLQMMKEKVQSASLVEKILIQKRITSDYQKSMVRRKRERSVKISRQEQKRQIQNRKSFYQNEFARVSQEFRRNKDQIREKLYNQDKRIWEANKEMFEKGRYEQRLQKQRNMRCNVCDKIIQLFKQRRAKSFHDEKLQRLASENLKRIEKIEKLNQICRRTEVKSPIGKRQSVVMRPLQKIVLEIQEGLKDIKQINFKMDG